tara:strand:- start:3753 stop:5195 length:1443 start_codon:yes stop_codon:yes gene_type:complete
MKEMTITNICCIGAGYVGGPSMSVLAEKCPNLQIIVVDVNEEKIRQWNSQDINDIPVYEPGLEEIIKETRGKNLHFSSDIRSAIAKSDMIFLCVNTPTKNKGFGAGQASDLKWIESCARQVANYSTKHTIVIEKSTLPVRTAETIKTILNSSLDKDSLEKKTFAVLSNPEFLAEGSAIRDLRNPDRVLIGGEDSQSIDALANIYLNWIPKEKIIRTNLWSSELSKLTANAFLAQRISSINSISAFCESTGGDIREVSKAIGSDKRIGADFLKSGPGFGGSCFKKDISNLVYLADYYGLKEVSKYWESVIRLNEWQKLRISKLIVHKLFGTLRGKSIAILGFAFKANTNDTRQSPSIDISKNLLEEGANLKIHDPKVTEEQIMKELGTMPCSKKNIAKNSSSLKNDEGLWEKESSINEALKNVDAILILTEWDIYCDLDWREISKLMRKPSWVFDTRSVVDPIKVKDAGLNLWRIGDGIIN